MEKTKTMVRWIQWWFLDDSKSTINCQSAGLFELLQVTPAPSLYSNALARGLKRGRRGKGIHSKSWQRERHHSPSSISLSLCYYHSANSIKTLLAFRCARKIRCAPLQLIHEYIHFTYSTCFFFA